jgi:hypothetical protein
LGDAGLEPPPLALSKTAISDKGGANSGALDAPEIPKTAKNEPAVCCSALLTDPDLSLVISAWPKLPECIRKRILLLGQGKQESVKLTWGAKGYERTVVDTTEGR